MKNSTEPCDFVIIGVQPVTLNKVFTGFRYKIYLPDGTTAWITDDQLRASEKKYRMIPEVQKAIETNLDLHKGENR